MKEIFLASASPRRAELLAQIGLKFKVYPSDVDETVDISLSAEDVVRNLSYKKAQSVTEKVDRNSIVIGADTIVFKDAILGKPENEIQAFDMLSSLQGHWHEVITGVTVFNSLDLSYSIDFEKTYVKMKRLEESTIKAYIKTGEPMDKAGAYGIQGIGALFIERIEGCYFNVVGLPLLKLSTMLEEFGVKVL